MLLVLLALQTVAVHNVHVVPMDRDVVLDNHVVVVQNGIIKTVGPRATTQIPDDATLIDGQGGYLVPGLADFHVHVRLREDLGVYLAYGVTTVADMGGPDRVRAWRDAINDGKSVGPQVFVGRFIDGRGRPGGVPDAREARSTVTRAARRGFDFIKVYNSLSAEQFEAIVKEAKKRRLPVVGHGVRSVGLENAFAAGQSMVVHAEEYLYTDLRRSLDTLNIPRVVQATKQNGAYVVPNLSAFTAITRQWGRPEVLELFLTSAEAEWLPEFWVKEWRARDYITRRGSIEPQNEFLKRLTLALQHAGVPLLTGTDSPVIPGVFPGTSLHDELRLLVAAGLTPFEALTAATRTAGEYAHQHFRRAERFGVVAPGYRADLVLVRGNPLLELETLRQPQGVMARGRWLDTAALQELLEGWSQAKN